MSTLTGQKVSHSQVFPEPTVGALIVNKEGKILLTKSHKWFDKYTLPGGHIEVGETMKEAVTPRSQGRGWIECRSCRDVADAGSNIRGGILEEKAFHLLRLSMQEQRPASQA
jgi:hypothetical protein